MDTSSVVDLYGTLFFIGIKFLRILRLKINEI